MKLSVINIINLGAVLNMLLSPVSAVKIHVYIDAASMQKKVCSSLSDNFVCED